MGLPDIQDIQVTLATLVPMVTLDLRVTLATLVPMVTLDQQVTLVPMVKLDLMVHREDTLGILVLQDLRDLQE